MTKDEKATRIQNGLLALLHETPNDGSAANRNIRSAILTFNTTASTETKARLHDIVMAA